MRVCGVDIKGTEAVICLLNYKDGLFSLPECRARKVEFAKSNSTSDLRYFQKTFAKLLEDYAVEHVVIRERPLKGKFAGGALGFKMEAAIQLLPDVVIETMSAPVFKESIKRNPITVAFSETGLKVFQEAAFATAYAYHMNLQYPPELHANVEG